MELEQMLEKPVPTKQMLITSAILFIIGLYLGQAGIVHIIPNNETASIIESEPAMFAMVGDKIMLECGEGITDTKCNQKGYVKEGRETPFSIDWDTGATSFHCQPIQIKSTEPLGNTNFDTITYSGYKESVCIP